jgi:hypothetical protein
LQNLHLIQFYSVEIDIVKFKPANNTMKTASKGAEYIFPVIAKLHKTFSWLTGLSMHETPYQFSKPFVYRAIPVYPGNPLFELLKRRNNNPLPFPSI